MKKAYITPKLKAKHCDTKVQILANSEITIDVNPDPDKKIDNEGEILTREESTHDIWSNEW
ncbi:MAG: hypothetical protein KBT12_00915 [Bacteroidales bacterium]|nr:hypothetical protein [Candidatus Physcousia equi]